MRPGARSIVPINAERLTSHVLGALRYLPTRLWLKPLLGELRRWNEDFVADWASDVDPEVVLWPRYLVPPELVRHVGRLPRERGGRPIPNGWAAPDAVVACDDWTLVLNVEGDDTTSAERIFQDYVVARLLRDDGRFAVVHLNGAGTRRLRAGVNFRAARAEDRDVQPEDELSTYLAARSERIDTLDLKKARVQAHLGWLNWQAVHRVLARLRLDQDDDFAAAPAPYQTMARRVRADAVALLAEADLVTPVFGAIELLSELKIDADTVPRWDQGPGASPRPAPKVEPKPEPKPAAKPEPKPAAKPEPKPAAKPKPKVEAKPEPKVEAKPAPKVEAKPAPKTEPVPLVEAEPEQPVVEAAAEAPPPAQGRADEAETSALLGELAGLQIDPDAIPRFPRPSR